MSDRNDASDRRILGAIAAGGFLAYMLLWWNQYFAPVFGEITIMNSYLRGWLPYRDWYSHQPPGMFFVMFTSARLFGVRMLPLLILGLVLRTTAVWVLYRMLSARRSPVVAAIASLVAAIASCSDDSEYVVHYHHLSVIFLLFGAAAAYACVVEEAPSSTRFAWRSTLAGAAFAVTFLIKQTMGTVGVAIVGLFCIAAIARRQGARTAVRFAAWSGAGFALVIAPSAAWLAAHDMLRPFIHLVYGVAPAAKGGIFVSLTRPFGEDLIENSTFFDAIVLAALAAGATGAAMAIAKRQPVRRPEITACAGLTLLIAIAVLVGRSGVTHSGDPFKKPLIALVYLGFGGSFVLGLHRALRFWNDPGDIDSRHGAFVGCLGVACAYSLAISWPAFEPMIFPAFAVALSEADYEIAQRAVRRHVQAGATVALVLAVALSSYRRHLFPYRWAYWIEPPLSHSTAHSKEPALAGITMSPETARFIDQATDAIRNNSGPDDTVIAFPHLFALAGLADRRPAGFTPVHWFDTCPDDMARADARSILANPPAVIVAMVFPEQLMAEQEHFFRSGEASGQRDLMAAIFEVVRRDKYAEVGSFQAPGSHLPVRIWARHRGASPERQ